MKKAGLPEALICRLASGLWLLLLAGFSVKAQSSGPEFSKQVAVTTENDRYLFQGRDRYYTNGFIVQYTTLRPSKKEGQKKLNHFSLGQKIYMPFSRKISLPEQIDRPVAGYLFADFTRTIFRQPAELWQWGVSAGAIGEASLGRAVQNTFHDLISVNSRRWGWVWDYQVKTEVGLNLQGRYARALLPAPAFFQVTPVSSATLGTLFTGASQGVLFQAGRLKAPQHSAFWNAAPGALQTGGEKKSEWFFFYQPELKWQVYNATVQGGLLRRDKGPITAAVEPLVLTHELGLLYSVYRYQLRAGIVFQGKEARTQRFAHNYGSLQAAYRFH